MSSSPRYSERKVINLAKEHIKRLEPCVHGGDVWDAASRFGLSQKDILDFSSNVNPLGPSPKAIEALKEGLWRIPFYPDPKYTSLRKALAEYHGVETENIIVGNGSTELIYLFCEVFLGNSEEVLIPIPTFGEYEVATQRAGGKAIFLKMSPDFTVNTPELIESVGAKSKLIFLCNPNNPTGNLTFKDKLTEVLDYAASRNLLVVVDEDFIEFTSQPRRYSLTDIVQRFPNLFILRSLTKFFGLAGLRLGYGVGGRGIINLLLKAKAPWNVNCLAEVSAIAALKDLDFAKKTRHLIQEERAFLFEELSRIKGLRVFRSEANFILIDIRGTGLTGAELKERLLRLGVLIRDCSSFRGLDEHYIRVSVRTRAENMKLLEAIKKIVSG